MFANADHLFVFTFAGEDAYLLRHELWHLLSPEDVTNLPDYTCYARWSLNGQRLPFFSLTLDLPPSGSREGAEHLREQCALHYGRLVSEVDTLLDQLNARHGARPRKKESMHEHTQTSAPSEPATLIQEAFQPDAAPSSSSSPATPPHSSSQMEGKGEISTTPEVLTTTGQAEQTPPLGEKRVRIRRPKAQRTLTLASSDVRR
ncbi:hypothetical protein KSB_62110 [Ktedonobacter robiniae]|uniref:Uncharacterized protein n=1 Tax=Ktedonobacter robiniae TaxID=2778365 RepID=A0ABQ3UYF2_9CHLR|nr:hypothetical protein KSB_62110 [Ktedonobacter robiniae]